MAGKVPTENVAAARRFLDIQAKPQGGGGKLPPLNGARVKTGVKHDFYQT